jgi:hypothetical protein
MPLVIETGACVTGADSWISLTDANTHFTNYGGFWTGTDAQKEQALRRAALWLSTSFNWHGQKVCASSMLAHPRTGMADCDGNVIADDAIAMQVIYAQLAAASYELRSPGALTPSLAAGRQVLKEKVDVIEVTYMTADQQGISTPIDPIAAQRTVLTQVNDLIRCFASVGRATPWPFVV